MTASDNPRHASAEVEVAGSPQAVWQAIATGPGISSWFMPATVEERQGGAITMRHEPGSEYPAAVSIWEPPHRFAYEEDLQLSEQKPPARLAHEFLVEARGGGTCVVRVVTSGFGDGADWDELREGMAEGWRAMLDNLRLVLRDFAGQPSASLTATGRAEGPLDAAWVRLLDVFGLSGAAPGDRVAVRPEGAPPLEGVVERVGDDELVLRTQTPVPGLAMLYVYSGGDGVHTGLRAFRFGSGAREAVARDEPRWQAWFARTFPPRRSVRFEVEVPGTPEEVWETIATGQGISAWFVPSEVEGREGGRMVQRHDQGDAGLVTATVRAWEPPRRFAFVDDDGWQPAPDAPNEQIATELLVEARGGGSSIVRLVASGFGTGADWDDAIERVSRGWTLCLQILRLVRGEFPGQPSASLLHNGSADGPVERGWRDYRAALGLEHATPGDRVAVASPPLVGTVAHATDRALVIRCEEPAPGIVVLLAGEMGERTLARVQLTVFGDEAEATLREIGPRWTAWMDERLPMLTPAG